MARALPRFRSKEAFFKPRARLLMLLGDQLIRDPGIAVFELAKNAYDADSLDVSITMSEITDPARGRIVVEDSGSGMDLDTVTQVWLEPGTDYRFRQQREGKRTPKYGRLPLGSKGIGRFAAHKLGRSIQLVTRRKNHPEVVVEIDWQVLETRKYLADVPIRVNERKPQHFARDHTGTRIEITDLREAWTRWMVRDLARAVNSICWPFETKEAFRAILKVTDHPDWLKGLLTIDKILEYALFKARCELVGSKLTYRYEFTPYPAMTRVVTPRKVHPTGGLTIAGTDKKSIDLSRFHIGPVVLKIYIFDREPKVLQLGVTDKKGLREFLDEVGGIRVYRDGIRVYDYGELGNDWLGLGGRRVNIPTRRISNNIVIGAASLDLAKSTDLVEKTNREGFVLNKAFETFRGAVLFAVQQIELERNIDKARIRRAYSGPPREPVLEDLSQLRDLVDSKGLTPELGPYLGRIESDFMVIRDRFLTSASAGLSLAVVIHEVEKGVAELQRAVKQDSAGPKVRRLAKHLADLTEGFAALVRKSGASRERASRLISQALFNTELRLKAHGITAETDLQEDFDAVCSRRLIIATLMNLIDNSIYWLDNKWTEEVRGRKKIYIGTTRDLFGGPAIVIADNGPGFLDPPEYLIQPFFTRKPDGMGLGLHVADEVMKAQGGRLMFPQKGDLRLPKSFDGAVVALVFGSGKT